MKKIFAFIFCAGCCALVPAGAAVLTGSVNIDPPTSTNLTTEGTLDWAIWNTTSSTAVASVGATNDKDDGPGLFSAITPFATNTVATNQVRGVGGSTELYTYSDGVSPTSQTNATFGFVANSTLATAGRGVQLSVTGNPSSLYRVDIWTVGFAGQGEMRVSLNGATTLTLLSEIFGTNGASKASNLFTFEFQPDSVSDLLNISFHLRSNDIGANAHVGIQAITVSAVPEPGTLAFALGGLGFLMVGLRRKRLSKF